VREQHRHDQRHRGSDRCRVAGKCNHDLLLHPGR
jgi:hypothetical protein